MFQVSEAPSCAASFRGKLWLPPPRISLAVLSSGANFHDYLADEVSGQGISRLERPTGSNRWVIEPRPQTPTVLGLRATTRNFTWE